MLSTSASKPRPKKSPKADHPYTVYTYRSYLPESAELVATSACYPAVHPIPGDVFRAASTFSSTKQVSFVAGSSVCYHPRHPVDPESRGAFRSLPSFSRVFALHFDISQTSIVRPSPSLDWATNCIMTCVCNAVDSGCAHTRPYAFRLQQRSVRIVLYC